MDNNNTPTAAGARNYMTPEIIEGEKCSARVDIWSLGCVIYELATLTRRPGDWGKNILEHAKLAAASSSQVKGCSEEYCGIVSKMLAYDPNNRPTANQIVQSEQVKSKTD